MAVDATRGRLLTPTAYAGFAVFGAFWAAWGASIPGIRSQAGITDGQLGTALLFVGAGALPAMLASGRLVDRWGVRAQAASLALLGVVGVLGVAMAHGLLALCLALAAVGAASGAADVAINATAGSAQHASGRPVIPRAHAAFSAAVVVTSLATGGLTALGAPLTTPFALVALIAVAVAAGVPRRTIPTAQPAPAGPSPGHHGPRGLPPGPILALGGLAALAFAVENGHQSWSALYLRDVLGAGPATAAAGPAVFAAVVAVVRVATGSLSTRRPTLVLVAGASIAAAATALVGVAPTVATALLGLALAAAGTGVLFPTLLGVLTAHVSEDARGAATSKITVVAYLGFLAGPVYVGRWAAAAELPAALLALAALAAVLAVLVAQGLRLLPSVPPRTRCPTPPLHVPG